MNELEEVAAAAGGAVWVFEQGGLVLLLAGGAVLIVATSQSSEDSYHTNRNTGFGIAMLLAAGLSMYLAVQMGGDPIAAAIGSGWVLPVLVALGMVIAYALKQGRQREHKRRIALTEAALRDLRAAQSRTKDDDMVDFDRPSRRPINNWTRAG